MDKHRQDHIKDHLVQDNPKCKPKNKFPITTFFMLHLLGVFPKVRNLKNNYLSSTPKRKNIAMNLFPLRTSLYILILNIALSYSLTGQIQLLNDEFSNANTLTANWLNINEVEQWDAEHLEVHDINTSASDVLHMMPWTSSWFQDYKGTLIFKLMDGDFVFTTQVTASNRAETGMPGGLYSLAGLMIRAPRDYPNGAYGTGGWTSGGENFVFLAAGFAATNHPSCSGCPGPHLEVKNTVNGNSSLQVSSISTYENVNIRIARVGDAVITLYQLPGEDWEVRERYNRSDFPDEVQIGFVTYTDWQKVSSYTPFFHNSHVLNDNLNPDPSSNQNLAFNPDLIGNFEFGRFDNTSNPFPGTNLVTEATDAELLSFLGYETETFCPTEIHINDTIVQNQIAEMKTSDLITADNIIELNSTVTYSSTNSIELEIGFESETGADLTIELNGCN